MDSSSYVDSYTADDLLVVLYASSHYCSEWLHDISLCGWLSCYDGNASICYLCGFRL